MQTGLYLFMYHDIMIFCFFFTQGGRFRFQIAITWMTSGWLVNVSIILNISL